MTGSVITGPTPRLVVPIELNRLGDHLLQTTNPIDHQTDSATENGVRFVHPSGEIDPQGEGDSVDFDK
jgi:hypothetical protein